MINSLSVENPNVDDNEDFFPSVLKILRWENDPDYPNLVTRSLSKNKIPGWRANSVAKSTCCSFRAPKFKS